MPGASIPLRESRTATWPAGFSAMWRAGFYLLAVALPLGYLAVEIARWSRDVPNWDEFDTVLDFLIALDAGAGLRETLARLLEVNNEHRMAASRLLFAASYWLGGGVNFVALAIVGNLFLLGTFVQLVVSERLAPARLRLAAIFALVVFQLQHHESLFWAGASIDHFFVVLAAVAALGSLQSTSRFALPIACAWAFLGTFSLAHGLVVWPVGAAMLFLQHRRRDAAIWAGAGAATLLVFFAGFHINPGHPMPGLAELPRVLVFWLRVAGSSIAFEDVDVAPWLGGVFFAVTALTFRRGCREREWLAAAVIFWCLGAMALIAWGRALLAVEWAPIASRYVILSSVAWALLAWVLVERALERARGRAWWMPIVLAGLFGFNLAANLSHAGAGRTFARRMETAVQAYHQNGTFTRATPVIYPHPERADELVAEAKRREIYELPAPDELTLPEVNALPLEEPREIADALFFIDEVTDQAGSTKVRGWAFRPDHTTRFGSVSVVFRSKDGLLAFEAMPQMRPDVAAAFERWDATYSGFELRVPHAQLPTGELQIGVCFVPALADEEEYMMTGNTVVVRKATAD